MPRSPGQTTQWCRLRSGWQRIWAPVAWPSRSTITSRVDPFCRSKELGLPALLPPPRREDLRAARERLIPRHGTAVEQILWDNQTTRPSDAELIRRVVDGSGSPDATH